MLIINSKNEIKKNSSLKNIYLLKIEHFIQNINKNTKKTILMF